MCKGLKNGTVIGSNGNIFLLNDKYNCKIYCPECKQEAFRRKYKNRYIFYHKIKRTKVLSGKKESILHSQCKTEIYTLLNRLYSNFEMEKNLKKDKNNNLLRPDIFGYIDKKPVAFEIQCSPYNKKMIIEKNQKYTKRGIYVCWIVPLKEDFNNLEHITPKKFERLIHTLNYGKCFYYLPGSYKILTVKFNTAYRWIKETEFYNKNGEKEEYGGYEKAYKVMKEFEKLKFVSFNDLITVKRKPFELKNENLLIPKTLILTVS